MMTRTEIRWLYLGREGLGLGAELYSAFIVFSLSNYNLEKE
jgi:hypothetical protein